MNIMDIMGNNGMPSSLYILFNFLNHAKYPNVYWTCENYETPYRKFSTLVSNGERVIGEIHITVDLLAEAATIEVYGEWENVRDYHSRYKQLFAYSFFNDVKEHKPWYEVLRAYSHYPYRRNKTNEKDGISISSLTHLNLRKRVKTYDEFLTEIEKITRHE